MARMLAVGAGERGMLGVVVARPYPCSALADGVVERGPYTRFVV
jgi:hypothetical protein